jgi:peptidoglycan/LPS O-acetylase OafA/YrhL
MAKQALMVPGLFKQNNFDLMRLIAAFQVVIVHGIEHLKVDSLYPLAVYLSYFPGVPVFFFLSGLLISAAWERNSNLKSFLGNRIYRIVPGLWFCVFLTCVSIVICSHILNIELSYYWLSFWAVMQGTFFPQWNPEFLDWFGIGVANGSLWTIPVELSFYVFLPIVYLLSSRLGLGVNKIFIILLIISLTIFHILILFDPSSDLQILINKLTGFSPVPWFWMFCFGVLVQRYMNRVHLFIVDRAHIFLLLFIAVSLLGNSLDAPILFGVSNDVGILNYVSLCLLVLSFGYTFPSLSDKLLNRNDISYGVYIYHMLVFNCLIVFEIVGIYSFLGGLLLTLILALVSWKCIERPFLRKRKSFLYGR